jgi:predicted  nucleic acid-binding Zn-ribbon protein
MPPDQLKQRLDQAEQALQMLEGQLKEATDKAKTIEDDRSVEMLKLEIDEYKAETERLESSVARPH